MNLFSTFEPSTMFFSFNWTSSLIMFLILPQMYWLIPSRITIMWMMINSILHKEFSLLNKMNMFKSSTIFFCSIFNFIVLNNFLGLFPYIFTSSSHISFSLTLSLPLWVSFMMFGWYKNTTRMFAHLTPQNAPNSLLPFLVIIETISSIIRPGTLAIRLMANMIAGHLLVTLMSNASSLISPMFLIGLVFFQILLLTLESAVSIIQAYVFSILLALYSSEVN
uniref:ATP synthase subunit a n=1 Tax=Coccotorus chaoi TaxID=2978103 RepID=A0A977JNZ7_9CUCU